MPIQKATARGNIIFI